MVGTVDNNNNNNALLDVCCTVSHKCMGLDDNDTYLVKKYKNYINDDAGGD